MSENAISTTAPPDAYHHRRQRFATSLQRPVAILAGHAPARNYATNPHPFRAASTYLYFGGPPIENAVLLIEPESDGRAGCYLLRPEPGPDDALWEGETPGDAALAEAVGIEQADVRPLETLPELLGDRTAGSLCPPSPRTLAWVASCGLDSMNPDEMDAIVRMRLIKDQHELEAMRRAAEVSVEAHRAAMVATSPGKREAEIAAAYMAVLISRECNPSFTPIATVRGEILHARGYPNTLETGNLLLVDAGAEEPGGYACDITRTWPVDGQWTPIQRQLYVTVLRAQREATAACVPGKRYRDVHDMAARVICEGLVEAELLRGNPVELAARYAHTLFFPHGLGHLIGLDAHDMEDFGDRAGYPPGRERRPEFGNKSLRLDRDLEPGMCVTIEPGIYVVPGIWQNEELLMPFADTINHPKIDALLQEQFGGIRIEDTICVRPEGAPENLTAALPSDPDAVLRCVGE